MSEQVGLELKGKMPNRGAQRKNRGQRPPKYGNKQKPRVSAKRSAPVFLYLCKCHGERATKNPCERGNEDRSEGKASMSPLGTWRCSVTRKKCKVDRLVPKPEKEVANEPVKNNLS